LINGVSLRFRDRNAVSPNAGHTMPICVKMQAMGGG
jgi:hypothetical protein